MQKQRATVEGTHVGLGGRGGWLQTRSLGASFSSSAEGLGGAGRRRGEDTPNTRRASGLFGSVGFLTRAISGTSLSVSLVKFGGVVVAVVSSLRWKLFITDNYESHYQSQKTENSKRRKDTTVNLTM